MFTQDNIGMTDVVLTLGDVSFQAFEIPSGINFGGRQIVAVHQLWGGGRVVDTVGPDEARISFSGIISGSSASWRAREIDALRQAGVQLLLTWDVLCYTVILSEFQAEYQSPTWIPFRICCTVVADESVSLASVVLPLQDSLMADLAIASEACGEGSSDFANARVAIAAPGAATRGTNSFEVAQAALATLATGFHAQYLAEESKLAATIDDSSAPAGLMASVSTAVSANRAAVQLFNASSYLRRAQRNLANASS